MNDTCAIIVCDHGLGHVRRCALMAHKLSELGKHVTLFAPNSSVRKLQRVMPSIRNFTVKEFKTFTTAERIRLGFPQVVDWLGNLPDLDNFETVICDNLPEILARRSDATISAHFFWHDVIEEASKDYAVYCEDLLSTHKPTIIGCRLFAMNSVRTQPGYVPTDLYRNPELINVAKATPLEKRTDLLVSGGSTAVVRDQLTLVVNDLLQNGPGTYRQINIDPGLMPADPPSWMVQADFTVEMYCRIKTAICRPGLGIITDLLTVDADIISVFEKGNKEMAHNALVLKSLKEKIHANL